MSGDTLKDFTQKVDRVLKYADGNLKTAQKIVKGEIKDCLMIKGKVNFAADQDVLMFISFFHKPKFALLDQSVVFKKHEITGLTMADSWRTFFYKINDCYNRGDFSEEPGSRFRNALEKEQNPALARQMIESLEKKNLNEAQIYFEKFLAYLFPGKPFVLHLSVDEDSSLEYEMTVKGKLKDDDDDLELGEGGDETSAALELKIKQKRNELLAGKNLLVKGEYFLSPVKGISLSELTESDVIGIRVTKEGGDNLRVLQELSLINERGQVKPCRGKILALFQTSLGYKAFVQIAPFVVVETRTEPEMKVECFSRQPEEPKKKRSRNLPIIIGAAVLTSAVITTLLILLF